ncbi:hypothetical protein EDF46_3443 [Frondihabitans sp. PhB188]|uniref:hypothetical protein n=1 Tax=Frondihabitans sp. PhB188 TaxID=2485200 RepID=UPI000F4A8289|nr:hypothetical protein [Frondihabitans sp. PhB188]ROQ30931.1 hypothetical protein EDF46_3443 [Frondihabitans sp. PhB188]
MTIAISDMALPGTPGTAKQVQLGPCALEIVCITDRCWDVVERLGGIRVNHGRLVFHGRHYTVEVPGGAQSSAVKWEKALRQHLHIR